MSEQDPIHQPYTRAAGGNARVGKRNNRNAVSMWSHDYREIMRPLGRMVRERRFARRMSQVELANACGMSQPSLSNFERGHSGINTVHTIMLMDRLGITIKEAVKALCVDSERR